MKAAFVRTGLSRVSIEVSVSFEKEDSFSKTGQEDHNAQRRMALLMSDLQSC